jgi:nitrate reductase gamma subunit
VKTVDKILGNFGSGFPYFPVIFVLFGKYGNRYENGIWCRGNRSEYGWASIPSVLDWPRKFGNFQDLFRISVLFIWAWPAIFFLLIQRFFKYSSDLNLQNKKPVLTKL